MQIPSLVNDFEYGTMEMGDEATAETMETVSFESRISPDEFERDEDTVIQSPCFELHPNNAYGMELEDGGYRAYENVLEYL